MAAPCLKVGSRSVRSLGRPFQLLFSQLSKVQPQCAVCQRRQYMERAGGSEKKSTRLKKMLVSPEMEFIMEAHNGISARIVEEAGFKGIWASGLSISTQMCVRDSNEASWTQVMEVLEFMNDACDIPILVDADTGYGNFNNARRLVRKLEDRGIAGAAVEDKLFPKTNSLLDGRQQPLADIEEFALKITAMKDTARDPDFCVVARVEALIAGWPMEEALKRADAFLAAGTGGNEQLRSCLDDDFGGCDDGDAVSDMTRMEMIMMVAAMMMLVVDDNSD